MRITQSMMNSSMMTNLQANYSRLDRSQEQLMTNKRINRPSDDSVGVANALRYRGEISHTDQFQENTQDADSWLKFNDTVMTETINILQTISEKTIQGATDTAPADARKAIAKEVEQLYNQLVSIGNSQYKGKYVFNGEKVDQQPFPTDPANKNYILDQGSIKYQVGAGIYADVNSLGSNVFGDFSSSVGVYTDTSNIFKVIDNLKNALNSDNTTNIQTSIAGIQTCIDRVLTAQSDVGAKQNRLEFTSSRLDDLSLNYTDLQSKVEDIDMPKVITDVKTAESIYQASLDTMARVIRPSLLDFLK
ncbi:flagellar hook-associated protein FlgL [Paenibacillus aceris]|uniref:Flagellar hook-associated protein 3 FlgL n=1 Tax=Paenibacillus aceris TaxID=869555 RepID=A0ABS4I6Q5_9BACL|nr:flagellar hook-associated protein 3 FlgL [Paenibacillus aceris]NHW34855.1 flagellar hook-associated protein FlgL [Paenibacillus aceris]